MCYFDGFLCAGRCKPVTEKWNIHLVITNWKIVEHTRTTEAEQ